MYLVDSGGQYKDGTTDVTRTLHFGTPKPFEKECFTRVLKGQLKVAMAVFPSKIKGNYLDTLARISLWEVGLDYSHGKIQGFCSSFHYFSWGSLPYYIPTKLYLAHTFEFPAKKGYDLGYDIYPKVFGDIDMI